jgi:exosortase/archaeosortase family protein
MSDTHEEPRNTDPRRLRRSAIRFVAIFVVAVIAVLTATRYAILTPAMNTYLFYVAQHTAFILDLVGYSAQVEEPERYRDEEQRIRGDLARWRAEEANSTVAKPLTAYEIWEHRALKNRRQLELLENQLAASESSMALAADESREPLEVLAGWVREFEDAIYQPNGESRRAVAPPEVVQPFQRIRGHVRDWRDYGDDVARGYLKTARAIGPEQHAFLQDRFVKQVEVCNGKLGPAVIFIAEPGVDRRLAEVARELQDEQNDGRRAALQLELHGLQDQVIGARQAGEPLRKDKAFRFHLVPDCGAIPSMAIFTAAVLAFPALLWKRLVGVAIGVPILYCVNLFRLTCLALIGAYVDSLDVFNFAHEYVWQSIYLVFVVAVWLAWIELVVRPKRAWRKAAP